MLAASAPHNCHQCGYDLRAHEPGEQCPECGTTISHRDAHRARSVTASACKGVFLASLVAIPFAILPGLGTIIAVFVLYRAWRLYPRAKSDACKTTSRVLLWLAIAISAGTTIATTLWTIRLVDAF